MPKDVNGNGEIGEGDFVQVNDKSVLPNLASSTIVDGEKISKASSGSERASDMVNLFAFAAKNSRPEWRIVRSNSNGSDKYTVGTIFDNGYSPSLSMLGISESSVIASMHSHNDIDNDILSERYSMGEDPVTKKCYIGGSDYANAIDRFYANDNKESYRDYNYFPKSGRKYQVTAYGISIVSRTIRDIIKGK